MRISPESKKETPWFLKALKAGRNPFFDKIVRKTGFIHLVREAGLEPARPEWTLEPESSESANSTTRAFTVFQLLGYITTDIPACQADETEKVAKNLPAFFDVCNRMCCAGLYIQTVIRRLCIYQNIGILSIPWPHLDGTSLFPICLRQHWHPVRVYRVQRGLTKAV